MNQQGKDLLKIVQVLGRGIPTIGNNIDTDAIIPAIYMLEEDFENGLGQYVFYNERFKFDNKTGKFVEVPEHPFNDPKYAGAKVFFVNRNFGCGSSREHAPQALYTYGIRAIVGEMFAAIFENNCKEGGMPAVTADGEHIKEIQEMLKRNPQTQFSLDLATKTLIAEYTPGSTVKVYPVALKDTHRTSFVGGMWNSLYLLLPNVEKVDAKLLELQQARGF